MPKILLVDDDLVVLSTLSYGLRQYGYDKVLHTDNGERAIALCEQEKPDLAILDIRMPGIGGIEVAEAIREKGLGVPHIFLTAYSDEDTVNAARDTGAFGYLVKPVEVSRIAPAIEIALARHDELSGLERDNLNLSTVLEKNREIDVAIGILMARYAVTRVDAFNRLRAYARHHRSKVLDVARKVVDGEITEVGTDSA